jgi:transposase, IS30 family
MPGTPLSSRERDEIHAALTEDREVPWVVLGRRIGRHPTTIMREVAANGGRDGYRPAAADRRALRCRLRQRDGVLAVPGPLRERIRAELQLGRSPVAIVLDMDADGVVGRPCAETIYTAVYDGTLDVKARECLRMRRPRRRSRTTRNPSNRPALPNIRDRPAAVNDRTEPGHWEIDQIIGAHNRSSMIWLTERVTRYSIPITMPCGYAAVDVLAGLVEACQQIPSHLLRSMSFDQGSEWAEWETIADSYGIDCWFCEPHSPWQRGQIENLNRQFRFWFPRGTDLAAVSPADAAHAATIVNGQRRRSLNNQSPTALYTALTVQ